MNRFVALAAALAALFGVLGVYGAGHKAGRQACEATRAAEVERGREATRRLLEASAKATGEVDARHQAEAERIRVVYRTIYREVPRVLTPEVDRAYPVPVGFVRLHDAAAEGHSPVPDPAGRLDDAPSGVAISAVAGTVVDNYETAQQCRAQVIAWQDWWRAQSEAWKETR